MRTLFLVAILVVGCARADTVLKNAGSSLGPIISLDCSADAGLFCQRPIGTSGGKLSCATATTNTLGCVSTGAQNFTGTKTFNGSTVLDGGVMVNGPTWIDAGTFINAALIVDGGVTAKSAIVGLQFKATNGFYVFATRADGGVAYLEGDDPSGKISTGRGFYVGAGPSIPQVAHLDGYLAATPPLALYDGTVDFAGSRFVAPAQFLRLSAMVLLTGFGDGGTNHDGGVVQSLRVQVYNANTTAVLCEKEVACNVVTGLTAISCAVDGGALVATSDDIYLRAGFNNCTLYPLMNVSAEYGGLP